jgi:hypothetical protein
LRLPGAFFLGLLLTTPSPLPAIQYFYGIAIGRKNLSGAVIKYAWKAASGVQLSLPLGTGIAKPLKLNETTWRFSITFSSRIP